MRLPTAAALLLALTTSLGLGSATPAGAADEGWIELNGAGDFAAWRKPTGEWEVVGGVGIHPSNAKRLAAEPGSGVIWNGPTGKTPNLVSKESFADVEFQAEFLIPSGSNSGVKFEGVYEIQILDSYGKTRLDGSDCGGIYPRAELLPRYHHLDEGRAPRVNATRKPGEWQSLEVVFRAPRFDADGKKVSKARFEKVVLNGQVIHEGVDLDNPTGHAWTRQETPSGPLLLQADHGPVAFRNVRVRRLGPADAN